MKKLFALALALTLMTVLAIAAAANSDTGYTITASRGTPVVDGVKDDIWDTAEAQTQDQIRNGTDTGTHVKIRFLYDDENLYFLGEVPDASLWTKDLSLASMTYNMDGCEICLSLSNSSGAGIDATTDAWVGVTPYGDFYSSQANWLVGSGSGVSADNEEFDAEFMEIHTSLENDPDNDQANPWYVEAVWHIKAYDEQYAPKAGVKYGFEISYNDNAAYENRTMCIGWSDITDGASGNASLWGEIVLGEGGGAAPAASGAPGQWVNKDFTSTYDDPDWHGDVSDVDFEDSWEEGATNARNGSYYVYLKGDGKGDYSVEFETKEDGLYEVDVCLMAWEKSVLRATNIKIDDSDWIRLAFDYENEEKQLEQYITGLTINLTKGTHKFTLGLPEDFDDTTVKTLYFDYFFYHKIGDMGAASSAPASAPADSSSAPDYVTSGLAAWYDGANNAAGSQDKSATVWKDSSGHGLDFEVELNDTNYWTDKSFHIDSVRNYLPDQIVDLVNGDTYTVEFVAGELTYPATDWVSLIISDNDHFSLFVRVSNDNLEYKYNDANKDRPMADNGKDLVSNSTVAITFDINTQDCLMYVDGELVSENVPIETNIADTLMLGHDDPKRIWSGDVYGMRFYDRVLSADEIAKNAAADNARFRGDTAPAPFAAIAPTSTAPAEKPAEPASAYPASGESGNFMMGRIIGNETGWDGTAASGAASAFDGKPATFFDPLGVGDGFCGMEFDEPYILEKVAILSRSGWLDRFAGASIEGSNDGEEWETLWESDDVAPSETEYNIVTEFENNYGYKMFRYINWINHGDVAEVEFYGKPGTAERPAEEPKAEPEPEPAPAEEPPIDDPAKDEPVPEPEAPTSETPAENQPAETPAEEKSGCGSFVGGGFIVLVTVLGSAYISKRR